MKLIYKIAISFGISSFTLLLTSYLKRRNKKIWQKLANQDNDSYYHCLFFQPSPQCRQDIIENTICDSEICSNIHLRRICALIASAKHSISMCMYHFTIRQITNQIIKALERGVCVRIIGDEVTSKIHHSQINYLQREYGIPAKYPHTSNTFMHHKFCLIDEQHSQLAKVLFGSLNFTTQGFTGNFEFVVITNNAAIVERYSNEFEMLWQQFNVLRVNAE